MLPRGYLQVSDMNIPQEVLADLKRRWGEAMRSGETAVVSEHVKFVPFPSPEPIYPAIVRCAHCGGWAASQTSCVHCGAGVG